MLSCSAPRLAVLVCCVTTVGVTLLPAEDAESSQPQSAAIVQEESPVGPESASDEVLDLDPDNRVLGDVDQFSETVQIANLISSERPKHLLGLDAFLAAAAQPDTVLLDTRSRSAFDAIHLKGAVNLEFADLSPQSLAKVVPTKQIRVLIYCNNNFSGVDGRSLTPLEGKSFNLALNIPTYTTLARLGYSNVGELSESVRVDDPRLSWAGSQAKDLGKLWNNVLGPRSVRMAIGPSNRSAGDGAFLTTNDFTPSNVDFNGFVNLAEAQAQQPLANLNLDSNAVRLDPRSDVAFAADPDPTATHVNFSDFTAPKLEKLFPDAETPLVVVNAGEQTATSLGPLTVVNLRGYGYKNVTLAIPGASQPAVAAEEDRR